MDNYTFLFPFEKIRQGEKILIYGAGDMGYEYCRQLEMTSFAKVTALIDKRQGLPMINGIPVFRPDAVTKLDFDHIVIALKTGLNARNVIDELKSAGVDEKCIVWLGCREEKQLQVSDASAEISDEEHVPFDDVNSINIAVKYGPGIGDLIIRKRFISELCTCDENIKLDIYSPLDTQIVASVYSDCDFVRSYYQDGGVEYKRRANRYDLAITCLYLLDIDHVNREKLSGRSKALADIVESMTKAIDSYGLNAASNLHKRIHFDRSAFKGENCVRSFNYTGVCNIGEERVSIPLNSKYESKYAEMGFKTYVTVNYGNAQYKYGEETEQGISKQWPLVYFEQWVALFKEVYPKIEVIQVGAKVSARITGVDRYVLGESFELVKYILKGAVFHLDIEGGLVHVATSLGTKCIVLFGPTPAAFFGYKQNINIVSEKCCDCAYLYTDHYRCAKGLSKPECMYSITPEMVMDKADEYMKSININNEDMR